MHCSQPIEHIKTNDNLKSVAKKSLALFYLILLLYITYKVYKTTQILWFCIKLCIKLYIYSYYAIFMQYLLKIFLKFNKICIILVDF